MADVKKRKMVCPKCYKEFEMDVWDKIEIPYDAQQKEQVMKNTLFRVQCPGCQTELPVSYDFEYNDLERKYMIWMVPKILDSEKARIMAYNKRLETDKTLRLAQGGYRYRLVRTANELREKVFIFDEGLDDRFIETMKLAYVPVIRKNIAEDNKILDIFFDKNANGRYQWVVILDKHKPMVLNIDMNIYHDMREKLWDIAEAKTMKGFAMIEAHWALDVMNTRVDEVPEKENI